VHYDRQETNGNRNQSRKLNWQFSLASDGLGQIKGSMGKLDQRKVHLTHSELPRDRIEAHVYGVLKVWRAWNLWTLLILVFFSSFDRKKDCGYMLLVTGKMTDSFQWTILQSMIPSLRWACVQKCDQLQRTIEGSVKGMCWVVCCVTFI